MLFTRNVEGLSWRDQRALKADAHLLGLPTWDVSVEELDAAYEVVRRRLHPDPAGGRSCAAMSAFAEESMRVLELELLGAQEVPWSQLETALDSEQGRRAEERFYGRTELGSLGGPPPQSLYDLLGISAQAPHILVQAAGAGRIRELASDGPEARRTARHVRMTADVALLDEAVDAEVLDTVCAVVGVAWRPFNYETEMALVWDAVVRLTTDPAFLRSYRPGATVTTASPLPNILGEGYLTRWSTPFVTHEIMPEVRVRWHALSGQEPTETTEAALKTCDSAQGAWAGLRDVLSESC